MKTRKHYFCLIWMLLSCFTSIQAQESAFEVLLTDYSNLRVFSFCCEAQDGYIVTLENKIVKLSQQGKVIREMTYVMDSLDETWECFHALIDLPNDPTRHIAIVESYNPYTRVGNKLHIITFDDDLEYDPSNVVVVDLSEEVQLLGDAYFPRYMLEDDGSLLFAANVLRWDDTNCLLFVRVSPEGETTIHFDNRYSNYVVLQVCDFIKKNDHYDMVLGFNVDGRDSLAFVTVGSDFELNLHYAFAGASSSLTPLQYDNYADSLFVASWSENTCAPAWLNDSVFFLPTNIYGLNHYNPTPRYGAGIWKLGTDFNILEHAFFDVFDTVPNHRFKLLLTPHPILVSGDEMYFCYTTYSGSASGGFQTAICKLDSNLNPIWKRWYGSEKSFHYVTGFVLTNDGGCLLSGSGHPQASHYYAPYPYVLKITSDGYCSIKDNEEPLLKPYAFFPNPVDDQLHMEFSPDVQPRIMELYDIQGRLVRSQSKGLERIDMSELPTGTYTLRIVMEDGTAYSEKVVKQ